MNNGGFCTAVCSASYEECAPLPKLMSQVSRHCKTAFLTSKCIHIMLLLLDNKGNFYLDMNPKMCPFDEFFVSTYIIFEPIGFKF